MTSDKRISSLRVLKNKRRGITIYHPYAEFVGAAIVGRVAGLMQHWESLEDIEYDDEEVLDAKTHDLAKESDDRSIVKRQHLIPHAHLKKFLIPSTDEVWALYRNFNVLRRRAPRHHSFCAHRLWSESAESAWMKAMEDLFFIVIQGLPENLEDPVVQETLSDYWALCRARLRVFSKPPRAYNFPNITRVNYDQKTRDREEKLGRMLYSDRGDETRGIVDALIGAWVDVDLQELLEDRVKWGVVDVDGGSFILSDYWAGRAFPINPSRIVQAYKKDDPEYRPRARIGNLSEVNNFFAAHSKCFLVANEESVLREVQAQRTAR